MTETKLDDWKPSSNKKPSLIQSEWRKEQNKENYNQNPGLDDIRKIKSAIKKKYPDYEIMQCYGINAETLIEIKDDVFSIGDGLRRFYPHKITVGKSTKMNLAFQRLEDIVDGLISASQYMGDTVFIDEKQGKEFHDILSGKKHYSGEVFNKKDSKLDKLK